jgi:hypothetical protein
MCKFVYLLGINFNWSAAWKIYFIWHHFTNSQEVFFLKKITHREAYIFYVWMLLFGIPLTQSTMNIYGIQLFTAHSLFIINHELYTIRCRKTINLKCYLRWILFLCIQFSFLARFCKKKPFSLVRSFDNMIFFVQDIFYCYNTSISMFRVIGNSKNALNPFCHAQEFLHYSISCLCEWSQSEVMKVDASSFAFQQFTRRPRKHVVGETIIIFDPRHETIIKVIQS